MDAHRRNPDGVSSAGGEQGTQQQAGPTHLIARRAQESAHHVLIDLRISTHHHRVVKQGRRRGVQGADGWGGGAGLEVCRMGVDSQRSIRLV